MVARSKATAARAGTFAARKKSTVRAKSAGQRSASAKQVRLNRTETIEYVDFVIEGRRLDADQIEIEVKRSPAGRLQEPVRTAFAEREATDLRNSFRADLSGQAGRPAITVAEATAIGKRLAKVMLPPPVFNLLARSIAVTQQDRGGGVRVRLALDAALIDLPWEYLYRPDRHAVQGASGFLLSDPAISLVRLAANPRLALQPIEGAAPLQFIGTFWEGRVDGWEVWREFTQLRAALQPVAKFVAPDFAIASDLDVFEDKLDRAMAILHYAGHCDFDQEGEAYLIREMPSDGDVGRARKIYLKDLAKRLKGTRTRAIVLSACNSGFWPVVSPLIAAGVPAIIGINGGVMSVGTIEFCTRLYEFLAVGLSLDEAVGRARLAVMEWGAKNGLFDWGLYMVYMASPDAVLFRREGSPDVSRRQSRARQQNRAAIEARVARLRALEGVNFGELMSELTKHRVMILGRFSKRRLAVLKAVQAKLAEHPNRYEPELFTYERPESRDLIESVMGFAALSRFVVADLTEPRSIQAELQAIIPNYQSLPVVPILAAGAKEFSLFAALARRPNVVPTVHYRGIDDLRSKIDREIVPRAEEMRSKAAPPPPRSRSPARVRA
jgi:hypothetical protein